MTERRDAPAPTTATDLLRISSLNVDIALHCAAISAACRSQRCCADGMRARLEGLKPTLEGANAVPAQAAHGLHGP